MILFTAISGNTKTGPIPVSGSEATTCPSACPFAPKDGKANGCYAAYGMIAIHWRRLNKGASGITWDEFLKKIQHLARHTLWRHNQFGDLAGEGNSIDAKALKDLTNANKNRKGFTYTHKPVLDRQGAEAAGNRVAIKLANENGFAVNLSANNVAHADELKKLEIGPVVTIVHADTPNVSFTPNGHKVIVCPSQQKEGVTCSSCKLCSVIHRSVIIGFKAHGSGAKYVEKQA